MTKCYLKAKIRKMEAEIMNARQAAKAAAKRIEELEKQVGMMARDIRDYNKCILSLISGDSACLWCEERPECQLEAKDAKIGCNLWWLRYPKEGEEDQNGGADSGKGENSQEEEVGSPLLHLEEQR